MKKYKRVYVEITNICNYNCNFCPKTSRPKSYMTEDNFEYVVKQIAPLTDDIYLHVMGEPLLHPQLKSIFEICKKNNLNVNITTNGSLLIQNLDLLKSAKVRKISISLHSFEVNKQKITLQEFLQNIMHFTKEITSSTDTIIEFRLWNQSSSKITAQNSYNKQIIQFLTKQFNSKLKIEENTKNYTLSKNIYLGFDNIFQWPINTTDKNETCNKFCYALRTQFGILCDGTVVPCCLDSDGKLALGNIFEQNIMEILSGGRATKLYNGFTNRNATEDLCKTCTYANRFNK